MIRKAGQLLSVGLLMQFASCGVYQAAKDQESTQGYSGMIALHPVTAVTGVRGKHSESEIDSNFNKDAEIIRNRKSGKMNPSRQRKIATSMSRLFGSNRIKKMSAQDVESLLGAPDKKYKTSEGVRFDYFIPGFDPPKGNSIFIKFNP